MGNVTNINAHRWFDISQAPMDQPLIFEVWGEHTEGKIVDLANGIFVIDTTDGERSYVSGNIQCKHIEATQ